MNNTQKKETKESLDKAELFANIIKMNIIILNLNKTILDNLSKPEFMASNNLINN